MDDLSLMGMQNSFCDLPRYLFCSEKLNYTAEALGVIIISISTFWEFCRTLTDLRKLSIAAMFYGF